MYSDSYNFTENEQISGVDQNYRINAPARTDIDKIKSVPTIYPRDALAFSDVTMMNNTNPAAIAATRGIST